MRNEAGGRLMLRSSLLVLFCLMLGFAPQLADALEEEAPDTETKEIVRRTIPEALRGPVSEDTYRVGPGDMFGISLVGPTIRHMEAPVLPEGVVFLESVGSIDVADLTLAGAKDAIVSALDEAFVNVDISVELLEVREIRVDVVGEVEEPGPVIATALDYASDAIQLSGGLTERGSDRNIVVRRADGTSESLDLVRYMRTGDIEADVRLRNGDIIVVPFAKEMVHISGSVMSPGDYELVEGETVEDLIEVAGGLSPGADPLRVELRRFVGPDTTAAEYLDLSDRQDARTELIADDMVFVRPTPRWHPRRVVHVVGEVNLPGTYAINLGSDRLVDIIERAGGFTSEASLRSAKVIRSVEGEESDLEFERLKNMDVEEMSDLEYNYFKTKARERPGQMVVDFEKLFVERDDQENIVVKNRDVILIPEASRVVKVTGRVASPGRIRFEEGRNVKYYIDRAGGYAWDADKGETRVIRGDTGEWLSVGKIKDLKPGDTVWVPERPDRDWWEIFKDVTFVVAELATIYVVVERIIEE
jgi:protein involved in polysaccharide export with SLBB domain